MNRTTIISVATLLFFAGLVVPSTNAVEQECEPITAAVCQAVPTCGDPCYIYEIEVEISCDGCDPIRFVEKQGPELTPRAWLLLCDFGVVSLPWIAVEQRACPGTVVEDWPPEKEIEPVQASTPFGDDVIVALSGTCTISRTATVFGVGVNEGEEHVSCVIPADIEKFDL